MQIPSPNKGKKFTSIVGNEGLYYENSHQEQITVLEPIDPQEPRLGSRPVVKIIEVPENPEVVNLQTGESNSQYWKPELILDPEGCEHEFVPVDLGKREVQCKHCNMGLIFHVGLNYKEVDGQPYITLNKYDYPLV